MATSGTNYTGKWTLSNGVLTLAPVSGSSGQFRTDNWFDTNLLDYITLTSEERETVESVIFSGDVSFYHKKLTSISEYIKETFYGWFINSSWNEKSFSNLLTVDVSGLNVSGGTVFQSLFSIRTLTTIIGLNNLDVSSGINFNGMFQGSRLSSVNVSNFPLNSADDISSMFYDMDYCSEIVIPSNFSRSYSRLDSKGEEGYNFGISETSIPATKNGVTVTTDKDFFKLTTPQGGTWTRDISGTADLTFKVKSTSRDGNTAQIAYSYACSSATASVYLKKSSESSFPSTAETTVSLTGSGQGTVTVTLAEDDAYDVWIQVTDGTMTIYLYPSIDSNILLWSVDQNGNMMTAGDISDGSGNVLSDKVDASDLASVATSGDYDDLANKPTETDPVFTASDAYGISSSDISNWNGKQDALSVQTLSPTYTKEKGSNVTISAKRWGKVVHVNMRFSRYATTAGNNMAEGTISGLPEPVAYPVRAASYNGSAIGILSWNSDGINVRVDKNVTTDASTYFYFQLVYLTNAS